MDAFWAWWQSLPQRIDPVIFQIGSFRVQYYGLMYLVAFGVTYALVLRRLRTERGFTITREQASDLFTWVIVGLMVGARLGYVLFYNLGYYLERPLEIVLPFDFTDGIRFTGFSGMSYHGGLIGVLAAAWGYTRRQGISLRETADLVAPAAPLGYTFGRIGNFINGELYGRVTTSPIGMVFPLAPDRTPRHPSQLYEALLEGVGLFALLWALRRRPHPRGAMLALYLVGYGTARFLVEFFREPDAHIGYTWGGLTRGQLLCAGMIAAGLILYRLLRRLPGNSAPGPPSPSSRRA